MSSSNKSATQRFREAFERLKSNKPMILDKNTPVTQNNVAREAGRDPSALKISRYPLLVLEIQGYISSQADKNDAKQRAAQSRYRSPTKMQSDFRKQRDKLSSIVSAQNAYIEELLDEIDRLKSGKVRKM